MLLDGHVHAEDTTAKQPALTGGILLRLVFTCKIKAHVAKDKMIADQGESEFTRIVLQTRLDAFGHQMRQKAPDKLRRSGGGQAECLEADCTP